MKRFKEAFFVRLRIKSDEIVVQIADNRIIAGGDVVKGWVFNHIPTVTHRVFDFFHGVARCAGESCLGGGCVEVFTNGSVHHTVE